MGSHGVSKPPVFKASGVSWTEGLVFPMGGVRILRAWFFSHLKFHIASMDHIACAASTGSHLDPPMAPTRPEQLIQIFGFCASGWWTLGMINPDIRLKDSGTPAFRGFFWHNIWLKFTYLKDNPRFTPSIYIYIIYQLYLIRNEESLEVGKLPFNLEPGHLKATQTRD